MTDPSRDVLNLIVEEKIVALEDVTVAAVAAVVGVVVAEDVAGVIDAADGAVSGGDGNFLYRNQIDSKKKGTSLKQEIVPFVLK